MPLDAITPTSAVAANGGARSGTGSGSAQSAAPAAAPTHGNEAAVHTAELESARRAANQQLQKNGCELAFEFDDATGHVVVRLIDTKTKEVLRQVPSRETLAIARALSEDRSQGVLLHTNA